MQIPKNQFKQALQDNKKQIGLWTGLANAYTAELLAPTGFDWLLIDGEHAPNDPRNVWPQLQAVQPYPIHPIVRPVQADVALVKQYLDIGVQTLLIPMVETREQAETMVAATRYPPQGIRGVGAGLARASRWNQVDNYFHECESEICVLLQVESLLGLENLEAIASVEGVDGVFFGPADLSAAMGLLGQVSHPSVKKAILDGIDMVIKAGKAAGLLATDQTVAKEYLSAGASFVAVGVDSTLLVNSAKNLAAVFKSEEEKNKNNNGSGY